MQKAIDKLRTAVSAFRAVSPTDPALQDLMAKIRAQFKLVRGK